MDNQPINTAMPNGSSSIVAPAAPQPDPVVVEQKRQKPQWSVFQLVILIVVSTVAVLFIGLFIWMYVRWNDVKTQADIKTDEAVAIAVNNKANELEEEFTEREKYPMKTFVAPVEYGELSFEYPKTWSVYEEKDASSGGDYTAYLNPDKVLPVSDSTINALRVTIQDKTFDNSTKPYKKLIDKGQLSLSIRLVNGESADLYYGTLPNKAVGYAAIFRIRDKTAILQTDAEVFKADFDKILDSVKYNQ